MGSRRIIRNKANSNPLLLYNNHAHVNLHLGPTNVSIDAFDLV